MLLSHAELTLIILPESRKFLLSDLIHIFPVQCTIQKFLLGGAGGEKFEKAQKMLKVSRVKKS